MQTILGSGGTIGIETAKALKTFTNEIRLVSRNPQKVNEQDVLFSADLTNRDEVFKAVEGSEVVYLTVGLPYSYKVWEKYWPIVMHNTIEACKAHGSRLVFFDNIYMYDPKYIPHMTEDTPVAPTSRKGIVRAEIAQQLMDEVEKGKLKATIARSADFYGPSIKGNSVLTETVFKNLQKGRAANWLISTDYLHSYTYTPDAGKATALLGNTPEAFDRIWHLPTSANPMTGKLWIETIANELKAKPKTMAVSKTMVRLLGMFMPIMRETVEMLYQYDRDYVFDSSRFEQQFNFTPTDYSDGIKEIVRTDYS